MYVLSSMILAVTLGVVAEPPVPPQYWKARPPRVGDAAPPFQFGAVLSPGRSGVTEASAFSSDRLRDRVVVLDFFATWCAPCIAAIPHMDQLIAGTADLPVTYLAVGKEPADLLRNTLAKHPMDAPFVHDADGSVSTAFWVTALPHAVVIDRSGRIAAITHPTKLTRDVIARAAAPSQSAGGTGAPVPLADRPGAAVSLSIHTTENRAGSIRQHQTTGEFVGSGVGAQQLLRIAWGVGQDEAEFRANLPETAYDVHIVPPGGSPQSALALLRVTLDGLFGTVSRTETRTVDGYRLSRAPGAAPLVVGSGGGRRMNRSADRLEFSNTPMADIVRTIGAVLGRPVENATGLTGAFALELRWDGSGAQPVLDALRKAGFVVETAKVPVDVLIVEPRMKP